MNPVSFSSIVVGVPWGRFIIIFSVVLNIYCIWSSSFLLGSMLLIHMLGLGWWWPLCIAIWLSFSSLWILCSLFLLVFSGWLPLFWFLGLSCVLQGCLLSCSSICACAQVIRVAHSGWRSSCYVADALLSILQFWWFHFLFLLAVRCLLRIFCCIWSFLSFFLFWCSPVGYVLGFHCTCRIVGCFHTVFCSFLSPLA